MKVFLKTDVYIVFDKIILFRLRFLLNYYLYLIRIGHLTDWLGKFSVIHQFSKSDGNKLLKRYGDGDVANGRIMLDIAALYFSLTISTIFGNLFFNWIQKYIFQNYSYCF